MRNLPTLREGLSQTPNKQLRMLQSSYRRRKMGAASEVVEAEIGRRALAGEDVRR